MTLRRTVADREMDKFTLNTNGDTAVRVVLTDSSEEGDSLVVPSPDVPPGYSQFNEYNEITSVASGATATLYSYTVPISTLLFINSFSYSSTGLGEFELKINGISKQKCRSFYTDYNPRMDFINYPLRVESNDIVLITVKNHSIIAADFNVTAKGLLK